MKDKMKSRKFIFTLIWNLFVLLGIVLTFIDKNFDALGQLITFAGTITTAYVGIQGYTDAKK